ncbi:FecR family protein [Segatella sp.]
MMKETDIFNDESLQDDIQDLVAIEQAMIRQKYPLPNLDDELEKIIGKEKVDAEKPVKHQHPAMRTLMGALMGAAAMLAIVLVWQWVKTKYACGGASENLIAQNVSSEQGMAILQTADGEMITLTLSDGTEVKLNSNSKITYPHQFKGKERMIHLEGEAFFKVKHESKRPFVVDAGGILTKDLGTSFNIKAYHGSDCKVTLIEGKVEVAAKNSHHKPVILNPGQQYSLSAQSTVPEQIKNVNTEETTAWADGVLYYHDQPLEYILGSLAAYYRSKVVFKNSAVKTKHLDFSADKNGSIEDAVELLNNLGVAKVSLIGNTLYIE